MPEIDKHRWPDESLGRKLPPGFREIEELYLQLPPDPYSHDSLIRDRRTSETVTMQGIEYLLQHATGEEPFMFTPEHIHQAMGYANHYRELVLFPELWTLFKEKMMALPKGVEILEIITLSEKYDLK